MADGDETMDLPLSALPGGAGSSLQTGTPTTRNAARAACAVPEAIAGSELIQTINIEPEKFEVARLHDRLVYGFLLSVAELDVDVLDKLDATRRRSRMREWLSRNKKPTKWRQDMEEFILQNPEEGDRAARVQLLTLGIRAARLA